MNTQELAKIATEQRNPDTLDIDQVSTLEMLTQINREDQKIAIAIEKSLPDIANAVDAITNAFNQGGRLIYVGAGTSGRLGILDASECPPTYGVANTLVQGIIAGGERAIQFSVEGAEDDTHAGEMALIEKNIGKNDVICGIAASGRTPYVIGAMRYAQAVGAKTIGVCMSKGAQMLEYADFPICVEVGAEAIMGSTRMKAGTAQKLILNMLSTGAMIKTGKVYSNLMVNLQTKNAKLITRATRIVMLACECNEMTASNALTQANGEVKTAIYMLLTQSDVEQAQLALEQSNGVIAAALGAK